MRLKYCEVIFEKDNEDEIFDSCALDCFDVGLVGYIAITYCWWILEIIERYCRSAIEIGISERKSQELTVLNSWY